MSSATRLVTAEELLRMPEDGFRYELVYGELRQMSPAGHRHGTITANLTVPLGHYVNAHRLGVIAAGDPGFKLASNPDLVRAPDVAFIRDRNRSLNSSTIKPTSRKIARNVPFAISLWSGTVTRRCGGFTVLSTI